MKKVVIIGGGFAGAMIAKKMQENFDVTLIDNKDYFEFTPSVPRTLLVPSKRENIEVMHRNYLKNGKFIQGLVTNIDNKTVYLNNKKKLLYNYLVICSGSRYNQPFKQHNVFLTDRSNDLIKAHKRINNAKKILIVGGGLVGVEIAAEIATFCKNKEITIIQGSDKIIERNNEKSRIYAEKFFKDNGVKIVYNQRVVKYKNNTAITNNKKKFEADMILLCTGIIPNSGFLKKNFSKYLDDKGHIKVDEYLNFDNLNNVFAAGDVNNILEEKTAQAAEKQADIVIKNIISLEKRIPKTKYQPSDKPIVISLGRWDGIFERKNFVFGGIIPALMKWVIEKKTMWKYR